MSTPDNRDKAMAFSINIIAARPDEAWRTIVSDALNFLENGSFVVPSEPGPIETAASVPTPAAPRKPRAAKPTPAQAAENAGSAPAPAASPAATPAAGPVGAAQPAAPTAAAATPNKKLTLDDVRAALVQCQTRKGDKKVPLDVMRKYIPEALSNVTGNLPEDKYLAVITECAAA